MLEINTKELTKSGKHYEPRQVTRGGKTFQRKQLVGSDVSVQYNQKINEVCTDMDDAAEKGIFSTTKAAGLKEMAKKAGRLLEIEKYLYDAKKRAESQKK